MGENESNEWASYKDEHRHNIDLMDAVTKAFQTHPDWFDGFEGRNDRHTSVMPRWVRRTPLPARGGWRLSVNVE